MTRELMSREICVRSQPERATHGYARTANVYVCVCAPVVQRTLDEHGEALWADPVCLVSCRRGRVSTVTVTVTVSTEWRPAQRVRVFHRDDST